MDDINRLILSAKYHTVLSILKGFRNGAVYGTKIRFPHALVMTFLFNSGPWRIKAEAILRATYTHSRNLACFVLMYKTLTAGESSELRTFIAAFLVGYLVFGQDNKVNEQINLYLLSRMLYGLLCLGVQRGYLPDVPRPQVFPWFGALMWGCALWLFEHHGWCLQPSLRSSMTYLYHDSNHWKNMRTLVWHNK